MLPSGLAETVADEEDLARFLTSSSQFNAVGVKPAAFLPSPLDAETSVFRHGRNPSESLWRIGDDLVAGGRTLRGAAIFKAMHVRAALLDLISQEPPPRHANIVGWPESQSDPQMQKAERIERAALIARHAELVRR
jgi:hypothetical protein